MDRIDQLPTLPPRPYDGHKGTFGTALVVAGSAGERRMIGAAVLAATAATRAGSGLVRVLTAEPIINAVLIAAPHATGRAVPVERDGSLVEQHAIRALDEEMESASALVIGPGMGSSHVTARLAVRAVQQENIPVVADADALNSLAELADYPREIRGRVICTPHPGEFRRLAEPLGIRHSPTDPEQRPGAAGELAQRLGCIVVLKGAGTVITDGHRYYKSEHGHPCLATGGTGDILSGLIAGLIAQLPPPTFSPSRALDLFSLACIAVEAHAIAGESWAESRAASAGLLPLELADALPAALEGMRTPSEESPR